VSEDTVPHFSPLRWLGDIKEEVMLYHAFELRRSL